QLREAGLPRDLRGQRPGKAPDGHHQLQHRCLTVLGVVGPRPAAVRRYERRVQARRELSHLRAHALIAHVYSRSSLEPSIGIHREIWEINEKTWLPDLPDLPVHSGFK